MNLTETRGYQVILNWFHSKGISPFPYQLETWQSVCNGESGLIDAPTGCGKTFAVFLGTLIRFINQFPDEYKNIEHSGLKLLWITPLRALATDIGRVMREVLSELNIPWKVGIRNGDTPVAERKKQKNQMPEILIITPESLHLLLCQKGYADTFTALEVITVDEWHELLGSKRGVQTELAISRILHCNEEMNKPMIWGLSATIGNLEEAKEVLLAPSGKRGKLIRASSEKKIQVECIFPDEIEKYPWAGHLGIKLIPKIIPIIRQSQSVLIFINTRGMSETWYQEMLNACPELAGAMALHHGSIDKELRNWIESNLNAGKLKVVVCTASLDLGVDYRPVETVIQVGSPKGVSRFLQRAGRSGHQPDAVSKIYFLPTHSLELMEAAALKKAIQTKQIEARTPLQLCYDVLIQYLNTLAVSDGFFPEKIFKEIKSTYCFREISPEEWNEILLFITRGGRAMAQYEEFRKIEIAEDGRYLIRDRKISLRHRLHIGTIVSDAMLKVKMMNGKYLGVIEEYFISKLKPGDVFTIAGQNVAFVGLRDMTVMVRKTEEKKSIVPSWMGGRMPLSASLGKILRDTIVEAGKELLTSESPEIRSLVPLLQLQKKLSHIPDHDEILIEKINTKDGYHLFVYPFEGRLVHEAMAALLAYRIARIQPITFSLAMNDYGFELLSDQPVPLDEQNAYSLFSTKNLLEDIQHSVNSAEMAKRKFRDIAVIGGLIFQGMPGHYKKAKHLQSSASLLFQVFSEYEPNHLLLRQAYQEVMDQQMEEVRLRNTLERIRHSKIIITYPKRFTPFSFPIKADSLREQLSSEKPEDRIRKMIQWLESA
ncbi:MAG: ligase-associated DNA damage response DEXH box helicase [Chitinophagaceae bacterium]|nr:ligase-associated DNA damage response DEXH box helicase [Chitinophagaceae bacterium]